MSIGFLTDRLRVFNFGEERCQSGHSYGPAIRDHWLIHYISSGKGVYYENGRAHRLGAGQGFLIKPGVMTAYQADDKEPWAYAWVGYMGEDAERLSEWIGLSGESLTFEAAPIPEITNALRTIYLDASSLDHGALAALGGLYRFVALIAQNRTPVSSSPARQYCDKALWYMRGRCADPIRITDVANFVGLSRSQLFRVFQSELGRSPKQLLQDLRIEQAERLLINTALPLTEIAQSVSLSSAQRLSDAFARRYGMSPRHYRQTHQAT